MENLSNLSTDGRTGNALLYLADSAAGLWDTIVRAKRLYQNQAVWQRAMKNALRTEFSWYKATAVLNSIYHRLAH